MPSKENQQLLDAVFSADTKKVKSLLEKGVSPKSKDKDGLDGLFYANNASMILIVPKKSKHQVAIVQLLVAAGADVNISYKYLSGFTPLICCSSDGNVSVMEALLELDADIHLSDNYGFTALHRAALNGRAKAVELLLSRGAKKSAKNSSGETPLRLAIKGQKESSGLEWEDYPETIKLLKQKVLRSKGSHFHG